LPANIAGFVIEQVRANDFLTLPVQLEHALAVLGLAAIHQDPFDRLLTAQAQVEHLTLLTCDQLVQRYPIDTVW
jgi:PIN domain nuclease of toxin-antitoxin system